MYHLKSKNGFTLIELLVVIAIIGILAAIVSSSLNVARKKTRDTARIQAVKQLRNALELYRSTNGRYPGGNETQAEFLSLVPSYIAQIPTGPTGDVYQYQGLSSVVGGGVCGLLSTCDSFHLGVTLEGDSNIGPLLADRDGENIAGPTSGTTLDGVSGEPSCGADPSATLATDLCYDVAP